MSSSIINSSVFSALEKGDEEQAKTAAARRKLCKLADKILDIPKPQVQTIISGSSSSSSSSAFSTPSSSSSSPLNSAKSFGSVLLTPRKPQFLSTNVRLGSAAGGRGKNNTGGRRELLSFNRAKRKERSRSPSPNKTATAEEEEEEEERTRDPRQRKKQGVLAVTFQLVEHEKRTAAKRSELFQQLFFKEDQERKEQEQHDEDEEKKDKNQQKKAATERDRRNYHQAIIDDGDGDDENSNDEPHFHQYHHQQNNIQHQQQQRRPLSARVGKRDVHSPTSPSLVHRPHSHHHHHHQQKQNQSEKLKLSPATARTYESPASNPSPSNSSSSSPTAQNNNNNNNSTMPTITMKTRRSTSTTSITSGTSSNSSGSSTNTTSEKSSNMSSSPSTSLSGVAAKIKRDVATRRLSQISFADSAGSLISRDSSGVGLLDSDDDEDDNNNNDDYYQNDSRRHSPEVEDEDEVEEKLSYDPFAAHWEQEHREDHLFDDDESENNSNSQYFGRVSPTTTTVKNTFSRTPALHHVAHGGKLKHLNTVRSGIFTKYFKSTEKKHKVNVASDSRLRHVEDQWPLEEHVQSPMRARQEKEKKLYPNFFKMKAVVDHEKQKEQDAKELAITCTERFLRVQDGSTRPLTSRFFADASQEGLPMPSRQWHVDFSVLEPENSIWELFLKRFGEVANSGGHVMLETLTFSGVTEGFDSKQRFGIPDPAFLLSDSKHVSQIEQSERKAFETVIEEHETRSQGLMKYLHQHGSSHHLKASSSFSNSSSSSLSPPSSSPFLKRSSSFISSSQPQSRRNSSALSSSVQFVGGGEGEEEVPLSLRPNPALERFRRKRAGTKSQEEIEREIHQQKKEAADRRRRLPKRVMYINLNFLQCNLDNCVEFFRDELPEEKRMVASEICLEHCKLPRKRLKGELALLEAEQQQKMARMLEEREDEEEEEEGKDEKKNKREQQDSSSTEDDSESEPGDGGVKQIENQKEEGEETRIIKSRGRVAFKSPATSSLSVTPTSKNLTPSSTPQQAAAAAAAAGAVTPTTPRGSKLVLSRPIITKQRKSITFLGEEQEDEEKKKKKENEKEESSKNNKSSKKKKSKKEREGEREKEEKEKKEREEKADENEEEEGEDPCIPFTDAFLDYVASQARTLHKLSLHGTRLSPYFITKLSELLRSKRLYRLKVLDLGLTGLDCLTESVDASGTAHRHLTTTNSNSNNNNNGSDSDEEHSRESKTKEANARAVFLVKTVASSIAHCPSLVHLIFTGTAFSPPFIGIAFCAAIRANQSIRKVECVGCDRTGTKFEILIQKMLDERTELIEAGSSSSFPSSSSASGEMKNELEAATLKPMRSVKIIEEEDILDFEF